MEPSTALGLSIAANVIMAGCAILAAIYAKDANKKSGNANKIASGANELSIHANKIAEEANALSHESAREQAKRLQIDRVQRTRASLVNAIDLSPNISTMTTMRFPINLSKRRSRNEKETVHRRTDHWCDQTARIGRQS